MVAEPVRETGDPWRVVKLRLQVEVEMSRIIKKISQEKITEEKINWETEHINMSSKQHADEVVDLAVVIQRQLHQNQTMHRRQPDK